MRLTAFQAVGSLTLLVPFLLEAGAGYVFRLSMACSTILRKIPTFPVRFSWIETFHFQKSFSSQVFLDRNVSLSEEFMQPVGILC